MSAPAVIHELLEKFAQHKHQIRLVYGLYGLTEEEIRIVEGK